MIDLMEQKLNEVKGFFETYEDMGTEEKKEEVIDDIGKFLEVID